MPQAPQVTLTGKTELRIAFASDTVLVKKEEEAFSFVSLVADCGGVLGLFIGFNFLMVWDWIIMMLEKLPTKIQKQRLHHFKNVLARAVHHTVK